MHPRSMGGVLLQAVGGHRPKSNGRELDGRRWDDKEWTRFDGLIDVALVDGRGDVTLDGSETPRSAKLPSQCIVS
jgi:hypothetical protein